LFIQLLIGALLIGSVYGLMALGYSMIYKASGLLSFTQGELLMLGAFIGLTFYRYLNLPFPIALLITIIIMFFLGLLVERVIIRTLIKKNASVIYVVLATIALSIIFKNTAMQVWGSRVLRFPPIFSVSSIKLFGIAMAPEAVLGLGISIICMFCMYLFMQKTKYGTAMRAAAQDPIAASVSGINVSLTTGLTWAIASALAGVCGMLIGPIYGVGISMGALIGIKGFAAAIIGGYGNMYGAMIGGLLLGIIETFAAGYISSVYKDFISFTILIIFLIFKPTGLFNEKVIES